MSVLNANGNKLSASIFAVVNRESVYQKINYQNSVAFAIGIGVGYFNFTPL